MCYFRVLIGLLLIVLRWTEILQFNSGFCPNGYNTFGPDGQKSSLYIFLFKSVLAAKSTDLFIYFKKL